jgi:hypothetical protein
VNQEVATRAADYARLLATKRTRGLNGNLVDGNYILWTGAMPSLFTTKRQGTRGNRLMEHLKLFISNPDAKLQTPDFFCSMFVYAVYELALGAQGFGFDPYSVDPKFYHKILNEKPDLYRKEGKYIHVISNGAMRTECLDSVSEAIQNYRNKRENQSFKKFRRVSEETKNALEILGETVDKCRNAPPESECYDLLVTASLYYTRSQSEIPKFFPEIRENWNQSLKDLRSMLGEPLGEGSTFLEELDKTSFFRRLRTVRKA